MLFDKINYWKNFNHQEFVAVERKVTSDTVFIGYF